MAYVKNNPITKGLSGTFGKSIVFRSVGDRTIVSIPPKRDGETSPAQTAHRSKFLEAVSFARGILTDPAIKATYQLIAKDYGSGNAYSMAVKDYFNAPIIDTIKVDGYSGQIGEVISIALAERFPIASAELTIKDGTATLLESGELIKNASTGFWEYAATTSITDLTNHVIEVNVTDLAGNTATKTVNL
ncbi:MAG: hypothetical protein RIF33_07575 [Cyclobacteriaceae bacterium]